MSKSPSLQPLYNFIGWIIKSIKPISDVAVIKIRYDKRHLHQCPFCGRKKGKNRPLIQQLPELYVELVVAVTLITYSRKSVREVILFCKYEKKPNF